MKLHKVERRIFSILKHRCNCPTAANYRIYGGRGVKCLFSSFEEFFEALGERPTVHHSIDRIDANGHYEPTNVRWATPQLQSRNTRSNTKVLWYGEERLLIELSEDFGTNYSTVRERLKRGWNIYEAVYRHAKYIPKPAKVLKFPKLSKEVHFTIKALVLKGYKCRHIARDFHQEFKCSYGGVYKAACKHRKELIKN